jgi:hypothetical protein
VAAVPDVLNQDQSEEDKSEGGKREDNGSPIGGTEQVVAITAPDSLRFCDLSGRAAIRQQRLIQQN